MLSLRTVAGLCFLGATTTAFFVYPDASELPDGVDPTSGCGKALNTSITCDLGLGEAIIGASLPAANLTKLCTPACLNSIKSYRSTVASACGNSAVIQGTDANFPITYLADNLWYTYNLTCLKDASSGTWCSTLFNDSWPGTTGDTSVEDLPNTVLCSSCNIQSLITTALSPIGYDPDFADAVWPVIQSKCKINTSINDPGQAYINLTNPDPIPRTCLSGNTYTVKSGDNCQTIADSASVATNDLIAINSILPGCTSLQVGDQLCLPMACQTYLVQPGDTCDSITLAQGADVTYAQLRQWNPTLNPYCTNLIAGTTICVRTPGGAFGGGTSVPGGIPTGTLITTATPAPTDTAPGAPTNCGRWYVVQAGEDCNTIVLSQGITLDDFRAANPQINDNCTNLWASTAYCVYQVKKGPLPARYAPAPSTLATGTTKNCYQYYTVVSGDTCEGIAFTYVAALDDFYRWNSGLSKDCKNLALGATYCVWGDPIGATTTTGPSGTTTIPTLTMPDVTPGPTDSCTWSWCTVTPTAAGTLTGKVAAVTGGAVEGHDQVVFAFRD